MRKMFICILFLQGFKIFAQFISMPLDLKRRFFETLPCERNAITWPPQKSTLSCQGLQTVSKLDRLFSKPFDEFDSSMWIY